jgi:two-component system KDP operon response regulator KdpE
MNRDKILVVDDEPAIQKVLSITLESNDFAVLQATTGKEAITLAASHNPSIILLDISLPDISGQDVLIELRKWYSKPIIMLSVLDGEAEIVKALDHGANDYLTKPFRTGELLARIRASLRNADSSEPTHILNFGSLTIDLVAHAAFVNKEEVKLTQTEFQILVLFAKNAGKVLTHQYILKEVWGTAYQTETQYLRVFIGTLRKKIEGDFQHPEHIITLNGIGYRFH